MNRTLALRQGLMVNRTACRKLSSRGVSSEEGEWNFERSGAGQGGFALTELDPSRLESVGYELAPNIAAYKFRGAEAILQNVIEPNREVNPQYVNYTVLTNDDRIVTGMISNESETSVTLLKGENVAETVARTDIAEMRSSKLSLMPEGLESQIDQQGMSDLIAYILSLP